jgi:SAM-dependent methyltransferase
VQALKQIPFEVNSDGFDFDTEIILQLHEAGQSIAEVPIPSYYGGDISYVNGLRYAINVATDVSRYRIHKMGFGSGDLAFADEAYELKMDKTSSHRQILTWLSDGPTKRILDLGCSDGRFGELLRLDGHQVIGVDTHELDGVRKRLDGFFEADLNLGLPKGIGQDFDAIVAADVFEHLANPERALRDLRSVLSARGIVIASVPNVAHWYPRLRILLGRFDYERRGIFDAGHLRFFTQNSFERMASRAGMRVRQRSRTGLPVDVASRGGSAPHAALRLIGGIDAIGLTLFPGLFSYQLLFELEPSGSEPTSNERAG